MIHGKYKFDTLEEAIDVYNSAKEEYPNATITYPTRVVLKESVSEEEELISEAVLSDFVIMDAIWDLDEHPFELADKEQNLDNEGVIIIAGVSYLENKK